MTIDKLIISEVFFEKFLKIILFSGLLILITSCGAEKRKNDRDRFFLLGNQALKDNNTREAIRLYSEALTLDSDYADAFNNRGVAHMKRGDAASALLDFNQAILIDPTNVSYLWSRAEAYAGTSRYDKAIGDITVVRRSFPDSANVYFAEGIIHFQFQQYALAEASFTEALMRDDANGEAYINRGTVRFYLDKPAAARDDLEQGLQLLPGEGNAWNTLALVESAGGDHTKALSLVNKALDIAPNEAYFLNNRGYIYLQLDSLDKGVTDIDASLLRDPQNAWAYRNKGMYFYKSGNYDEALRLLLQSLSMDEQLDEIHLWLGKAYLKLGEKSKACESLLKAAASDEVTELLSDNC